MILEHESTERMTMPGKRVQDKGEIKNMVTTVQEKLDGKDL